MSTQKALVITGPGTAAVVNDRPIPALRDDYLLIKTVSVALNPTDWKHIEWFAVPGLLTGCDYAGIVEAVGKNVKKQFKKGDRVCGWAHGANRVQPEDGAFAEYILAKGDLQLKIPDNISFQEAATFGVAITTVAQSLYQSLKLALPTEPIPEPKPILIYGGSTATGTVAIQFAKLSGYTVLTTCSPHNFDLVRGLGADAVFDYRAPQAGAEIRKATNDKLKLVLDCIGGETVAALADAAVSSEGGDYTTIAIGPEKPERVDINYGFTVGYTAVGEECFFVDQLIPAKPEDLAHCVSFVAIAGKLIAQGKIKPHPLNVGKGGLHGVIEGLQLMKADKVSGQKLVYNIADTA